MSPLPPGLDGEDRPLRRAAAGDDDEVLREDRRRRRDLRAAAEAPALGPGVGVVAADEVRGVRHELCGAPPALEHGRRAPRRQFLADRLPHGLPRLHVRRHHERFVLRVALHDDEILVDDRRAGRAPFVLGQIVGAGIEHAEILLPRAPALHVERVEPLRSEERDDVAAVGERRGVGVGRLDVTLFLGNALVRRLGPDGLPRGALERHHDPLLRRAIFGCGAVTVEAGLERHVGAAADRARHENPVPPDDRTRMREPGDRDLPPDVAAADAAPRVGQFLPVGHTRRRRPTKPGPVVARGRRGSRGSEESGCTERKGTPQMASCHGFLIWRRW